MKVTCTFYDQDTHEFIWKEQGPEEFMAFASKIVHHEGTNYKIINAYASLITKGWDFWVRKVTEEDKKDLYWMGRLPGTRG